MAKIPVRLKIRGIRETLRSPGVQADLAARGARAARAAGDGFESVVKPHKYTSRVFVQTNSAEGEKRQAEDAVLERSLGAAR